MLDDTAINRVPTTDDPTTELIARVQALAKQHGAQRGARRLDVVKQFHATLAPEALYRWMDPDGLTEEVEDAQLRAQKVHALRRRRNVLAVVPIVLTWTSITLAIILSRFVGTDDLAWWFGGTAALDAAVLGGYLFTLSRTQQAEERARTATAKFADELSDTLQGLQHLPDVALPALDNAGAADVARIIKDSIQASERHHMAAITALRDQFTAASNQLHAQFSAEIREFVATEQEQTQAILSEFRDELVAIVASYRELAGELNVILPGLADSIRQLIPLVTNAVNATAGLADSVANLHASTEGLRTLVNQLGRQEYQLTTALETIAANTGNLFGAFTPAAEAMTRAADAVALSNNQISGALTKVGDAAIKLETLTTELPAQVGAITTKLGDAARAMENNVSTIVGAVNQMNGALTQFIEAARYFASMMGTPPRRRGLFG